MKLITREELKQKIDAEAGIKLVMTMPEWAFQQAHIPTSINIYCLQDALRLLSPDDEIVVYCSHELCPASRAAYRLLKAQGYCNVRRYAGGLTDWATAGYSLANTTRVDRT